MQIVLKKHKKLKNKQLVPLVTVFKKKKRNLKRQIDGTPCLSFFEEKTNAQKLCKISII